MRRGAALAAVGVLLALLCGTPALAGSACPQPDSGVTVVVDFRAAGGGIEVGCAPGSPGSGFAALTAAGFGPREVQGLPGFLCTIDGLPASEDCADTPSAEAFWSYWHADRGGDWTYSLAGGAARVPAPGSVDGWAFGAANPPGLAPPNVPPPPTATTTSTVPEQTTTTAAAATTTTATPVTTSTSAPPSTTTSTAAAATTTTIAPTTTQPILPTPDVTTTEAAVITPVAAESATPSEPIAPEDPGATIVGWGALGVVGVAGAVTAWRRRTRI